jgi:class 3 adenylate cyclase
MPLYLDRHYIEHITRKGIADAHEKDLVIQEKYGVKFLTYWIDEARCTTFCLVEAPNKEAIRKSHAEAHGAVPSEIIEVESSKVEAFLGRINDPVMIEAGVAWGRVPIDSGYRAIMFTDLKGSTAMTTQFGDKKSLHLLHIHNALTRNALSDYAGREVKHLGDGIMASFASQTQAVECAMAIQSAFATYNTEHPEAPLHLRIGLSAGEPVEEDHDLFGATVQLAARLCAHAEPDQILVSQSVMENYSGEKPLFSEAGQITLKGFDQPVQVYDVKWRQT